jgi:hypothetical protein
MSTDCFYQTIGPTYFKDDYNTHDEKTTQTITKDEDPRPPLGTGKKFSDVIQSKESIENTTTKTTKVNPIQLKGNSTIASESFGSIYGNMVQTVSNFSYDMNHTDDKDYSFSDLVKLHMLTMARYMDTGPDIAYIGVFLIFLSFFIYILSIVIRP